MSNLVELLHDLVSIDSVNPRYPGATQGERNLAEYVHRYYETLGVDVESYEVSDGRPNVIARLMVDDPVGTVLLDAHTDTVGVNPHGPELFRPRVKDGRLYGRGACDDKGSLSAMMVAMANLVARRSELRVNVVALASADEESGGSGINSFVDRGERIDAAIVGEPTELQVVRAHKSGIVWGVTAVGEAAHSSKPEIGVNAIYQMMPVLQAIKEEIEPALSQITHPLLSSPTITPTLIEGGTGANIVPPECTITLSRRCLPTEDSSTIVDEMRDFFTRLQDTTPGLRLRITEPQPPEFIGLDTPADEPIVRAASQAIRSIDGDGEPQGVPYGSHAVWLSGRGRIPCVVLGPGFIDDAHTATESVSLAELTSAPLVYEQSVLNFSDILASNSQV